MSSERLTDEELARAERFIHDMRPALPSDWPNMTVEMVRGLVDEVLALRADIRTRPALSADEVAHLRSFVRRYSATHATTCALLDKLLAHQDGGQV